MVLLQRVIIIALVLLSRLAVNITSTLRRRRCRPQRNDDAYVTCSVFVVYTRTRATTIDSIDAMASSSAAAGDYGFGKGGRAHGKSCAHRPRWRHRCFKIHKFLRRTITVSYWDRNNRAISIIGRAVRKIPLKSLFNGNSFCLVETVKHFMLYTIHCYILMCITLPLRFYNTHTRHFKFSSLHWIYFVWVRF